MDHSGSMMYGNGNSLNSLVGGLLIFFVKLLMIVLVIAFIAGILVWIRNNFHDGYRRETEQKPVTHSIHNDPVIKTATWTALAVIGIVLLNALFMRLQQNGMMGMNGYSMGMPSNSGYIYGITSLLMILAKILTGIFAISIIMAAIVYIKTQYESGNFNFAKTTQRSKVQIVDIQSDGRMRTDIQPDQTNT